MPHVIVKLHSGRTQAQKTQLAEELARAVMAVLGSRPEAVSVAIEDVEPQYWAERVFRPDIIEKPEQIYRKPGYDPFA